MSKKTMLLAVLSLSLLVVVYGCDMRYRSSDNSEYTSLEDEYIDTVNHMHSALDWHIDNSDPASTYNAYLQDITEHLANLSDLREQMRDGCQYTDECLSGGGVSGSRQDDCLWGGHIMGPGDMKQMQDDWTECTDELNHYRDSCPDRYDSAVCDQPRRDHADSMGAILERMVKHYGDWWSEDWDEDHHDHWGDCSNEHGHDGGGRHDDNNHHD